MSGQQQIHGCPGGPLVLLMQGFVEGGCSLRYNTSAAVEKFKMIFVLLAHSPINLLHCYYAGTGGKKDHPEAVTFFLKLIVTYILSGQDGWEIA